MAQGGGAARAGLPVMVALACAIASLTVAPDVATGTTTDAAPRPCSNGLVALTFDDGPSRTVTPRLLDVLESRRTPATFFVVGERVAAAPRVVRRAHRSGFVIANHTYRHEQLTRLSDAAIRTTLHRTRQAVTNAGAAMSRLMRPPYGLIDDRVRRVVQDLGLTPVLWTVDPRDWEGIGSAAIADRVMGALRPDRPNVVLLHDGIGNSPNTLRAVPDIIRRARDRGYCFAGLGADGRPKPPVPLVRVRDAGVKERTGELSRLRFVVTLDRPTSRPTSIRIATEDRSAIAGTDYTAVAGRLWFPTGTTRRVVSVRISGDALDERRERLVLEASEPRGVRLRDRSGAGRIADNDRPPGVLLEDIAVTEPDADSVVVHVPVLLTRASGRRVTVTAVTHAGTASTEDFVSDESVVVIPAGQVAGTVPVEVLADELDESPEEFTVVIELATHASVVDGSATVTIGVPASGQQPPPP